MRVCVHALRYCISIVGIHHTVVGLYRFRLGLYRLWLLSTVVFLFLLVFSEEEELLPDEAERLILTLQLGDVLGDEVVLLLLFTLTDLPSTL